MGKDCQNVTFLLDNLPENFPCSYVFDLILYVGGSHVDVIQVTIDDSYSASLTVTIPTALKVLK